MKKKFNILVTLLAILTILTGCTGEVSGKNTDDEALQDENVKEEIAGDMIEVTEQIFAMDTYMTLTAYGDNASPAVSEAISEIERLDALLSTESSSGEVYKLNNREIENVSEDISLLISHSLEYWEKTEGAFDIAVYPIMEAWGFVDDNYRVPHAEELQQLLQISNSSLVEFNTQDSSISFKNENVKIGFGGIAKGYTSSRIMEIFKEHDIEHAIVNLGGNVQTLGDKPDASKWRVAISETDSGEDYIGVVSIKNKAAITSGGYERYFEQDGKTYHHIIDTKTGMPANNGIISVTIISGDGVMADALSTSLFVMGKEDAISYWRENFEEFDTVIKLDTGELLVTEGVADDFTSDYDYSIIYKEDTDEIE